MKPVLKASTDPSKQEDFTGPTYAGISNVLHDILGLPRFSYHLKKSETTGNIVLDMDRPIEKPTVIDVDHEEEKPKLLD